jgi:hypothetical protein
MHRISSTLWVPDATEDNPMKLLIDTDHLTVAQLYALSWMVYDLPDIYKAVAEEHNRRDAEERMRKRAQFIEENPDAFK